MELEERTPAEEIDGCHAGAEVVYTDVQGTEYRALVRNVRNRESGVVDLSVYVGGTPYRFYMVDHDLRGAFHTWRRG